MKLSMQRSRLNTHEGSELSYQFSPDVAVRTDRSKILTAKDQKNRQTSKNESDRSSANQSLENRDSLKNDVARKALFEKKQLELRYDSLNREHHKLQGKYEKLKKQYVKLKEKYKQMKWQKQNYRPEEVDEEEEFMLLEKVLENQENILTSGFQENRLMERDDEVLSLARSSSSIMNEENAQLRSQIYSLREKLETAYKYISKEDVRYHKFQEMQKEFKKKYEMLKAENEKLLKIKEIVKDIEVLPDYDKTHSFIRKKSHEKGSQDVLSQRKSRVNF